MPKQPKGLCAWCGYEGALTKAGTPRDHGERRRGRDGVRTMPGSCPGAQMEAEPVSDEPTPTTTEAAVTRDPGEGGYMHRQQFELLRSIVAGHVYVTENDIVMVRGRTANHPASKKALREICHQLWAEQVGYRYVATMTGENALMLHRQQTRAVKS